MRVSSTLELRLWQDWLRQGAGAGAGGPRPDRADRAAREQTVRLRADPGEGPQPVEPEK